MVFLRKPDAKLETGMKRFRPIALISVLAKWFAAVVVNLLQEGQDPVQWEDLNVERRGA